MISATLSVEAILMEMTLVLEVAHGSPVSTHTQRISLIIVKLIGVPPYSLKVCSSCSSFPLKQGFISGDSEKFPGCT